MIARAAVSAFVMLLVGDAAHASGGGGCRISDKSLSLEADLVVGSEGVAGIEQWTLVPSVKAVRDAVGEPRKDAVAIRKSWISDYSFHLHADLKDAVLLLETRRPRRFDDQKDSFPIVYRGIYVLAIGGDDRTALKGEAECWLWGG